ncbi:hypothetical protein D1818_15440 [Aquimarina sp. BL5]|uniref:hypothetical protein n=1 Tax=Aquimarina sp. BL5 TaxID=1714860 RepID=UPI000E47CFA6|nr:hypothetical protein [Aquimarina sp. BL5]AXT52162.1 hypothetical protein D1818_15440 [Aquimarina sp. BL5]RKN10818.1 hypothetical protein D7036_02105 [Aquimarina sp. BL5]
MEIERVYSELINTTEEIVIEKSKKTVDLDTVILMGSNHNIRNIDEVRNKDSDIDILILSEGDPFQIHTEYKGVKFDISIIDHNDVINFILAAFNGSPTASKIFSSSNQWTVIRDKKGIGISFVDVIEKTYNIFTQACLPNYSANNIFLHNIAANFTDTRKQDASESFFAYNRLSNHLFDYISKLIYPFHTSGSYRGKIFKEYIDDFEAQLLLKTNDFKAVEDSLVLYYINKFTPVTRTKYRAITYSPSLEKEILSGNIITFYFGFDNLISESIVMFIPEEEFFNNKNKGLYKLLDLDGIIPFLSEDQLAVYNLFLGTISKKYLSSDIKERKHVLSLIINRFEEEGFGKTIIESVKAILMIKTCQEISKENIFIDLEGFKEWLLELDIVLPSIKHDNDLPENIEQELPTLFEYIKRSDFAKEKEIKIGYIFFGIISALRIQITDLDL